VGLGQFDSDIQDIQKLIERMQVEQGRMQIEQERMQVPQCYILRSGLDVLRLALTGAGDDHAVNGNSYIVTGETPSSSVTLSDDSSDNGNARSSPVMSGPVTASGLESVGDAVRVHFGNSRDIQFGSWNAPLLRNRDIAEMREQFEDEDTAGLGNTSGNGSGITGCKGFVFCNDEGERRY
jgi:hypothetical protein